MDDDGVTPGLTGEKPTGPNGAPGPPILRQQDGKIPQMPGMPLTWETPVVACAIKWFPDRAASAALVQVQAKESVPRQPLKLGHHHSPALSLIHISEPTRH